MPKASTVEGPQVIDGKLIGILRNNWRERLVRIYATDDPETVFTVGEPFVSGRPVVECMESRDLYKHVIAIYPRVSVCD
jgi:hypothetical protein